MRAALLAAAAKADADALEEREAIQAASGVIDADSEPWRRPAELADWPDEWRERFGRRANELADAGWSMSDRSDEREAFRQVSTEKRAAEHRTASPWIVIAIGESQKASPFVVTASGDAVSAGADGSTRWKSRAYRSRIARFKSSLRPKRG